MVGRARDTLSSGWQPRVARTLDRLPLIAGCSLLLLFVVLAACAPLVARWSPLDFVTPGAVPPSGAHWMGTTTHGQDVFAQWVHGARFSLAVGFTAGIASMCLSVLVGVTAAYVGGWLDDLLTFVMNVFLIVPPFPLVFVLAVGATVTDPTRLVVLLTLTTWSYGARLLRSQTLSLRNRDFILAAAAIGEGPPRLILYDILPHLLGLCAFVLINAILFALQAEFGLEFLGWGVVGSAHETGWGTMLYNARYDDAFFAGSWWYWLFPALGIGLTGAALTMVNAGIDAIGNPRLGRR